LSTPSNVLDHRSSSGHDASGESVAVDGATTVVGAWKTGSGVGVAYLYKIGSTPTV
jgi:hypothetical protein